MSCKYCYHCDRSKGNDDDTPRYSKRSKEIAAALKAKASETYYCKHTFEPVGVTKYSDKRCTKCGMVTHSLLGMLKDKNGRRSID